MEKKKKKIVFKISKILGAIMTFVFSCSVYASSNPDFSYIHVSQASNTKLVNPLYLDKSKTEKPAIKVNSINSYSGIFDESDYFSSSIDDSSFDTNNTNSYNKTSKENNTPPIDSIRNEKQDVNFEDTSLGKNNYFAPPSNEIIETGIENAEHDSNRNDTIFEEDFQENTYYATTDEINSLDIEGKLIAEINTVGLNTIQQSTVLSVIKTQTGALFNTSILQEDLQRIYAMGFFTDNMAIEPSLNKDDTVNLTISLEENVLVKDILLSGNTVISTSELLPFVDFMKNKPQNITSINQAIDRINNYYSDKGYILAQVNSVDDDNEGNLMLGITEGIINKIIIEGNEKTKDYVIERNIITQAGSVYNENYLKEDLTRIFSTHIFEDVERKIEPCESKDGEYNVKVIVKEQSTNSVGIGGGIDNALGAFGSISLKEDNFLGKGQQVSLSGILGSGILLSDASIKNRMNYQLELSFFEPYFLNADNSLASKLYYRNLGSYQIPLAIERRIGFNTVVEHKIKNHKNLSTTFGTGIEHIALKEGDFSKISQLYTENNLDIANRAKQLTDGLFFNLSPGIKYSTIDTEENPRNGYIAQAKFIESFGLSEFNNTNGRLTGGVTKYFPVKEKSSLAITARAGAKVHGDDMPEVMAFRLGGPYSVRGFKMNGVGTGDGFLMGSVELATPLPFVDRFKFDFLKKMRLTFFIDAGHTFDATISSTLYDRPLSAISAGIGLKMYVPGVGPISVDYGLPLTNTGRYGSNNGYFTFGTGGLNGYGW